MLENRYLSSILWFLGGSLLGSTGMNFTSFTLSLSFTYLISFLVVGMLAAREIRSSRRQKQIGEHREKDNAMTKQAFGKNSPTASSEDLVACKLESAEWLNGMLKDLWPYISRYTKELMETTIQPIFQELEPKRVFSSFEFTKIDLGTLPPRVERIASYRTKKSMTKAVVIEQTISFCSDMNISIKLMGMIPCGIKDVVFRGKLRVRLEPLISQIPFFASVQLMFEEMPQIDFDLTGVGGFAEVPGLISLLHDTVQSVFGGMMVKPNKFIIPMISTKLMKTLDIKSYDIMHPFPKAIIHTHVIRATSLMAKDNIKVGGVKLVSGSSDPYMEIVLGSQMRRTKTIQKNLSPTWDEKFWLLVTNPNFQKIKLHCWDDDTDTIMTQLPDDLGDTEIEVSTIYSEKKVVGKAYELDSAKSGHVYVDFYYYVLKPFMEIADDEVYATVTGVTVESVYNIPKTFVLKHPTMKVQLDDGHTGIFMYPEVDEEKIETSAINFDFNHFFIEKNKVVNEIDREVKLMSNDTNVLASGRIECNTSTLLDRKDGYFDIALTYTDQRRYKSFDEIRARVAIRIYRAVEQSHAEGKLNRDIVNRKTI